MGFGAALAGIGTVTGIYSGNKAASAQRGAAGAAASQLGAAKGEAIGYLDPWSQAGRGALSNISGLTTGKTYDPETGEATQLSDLERSDLFQQSPGYQFRLDEAMKALQSSQAAKGGLLSGGAAKELTQYSQGIASDEYGSYLNQLFQLSGMGQQADMAKANVATGMGSQMAQAAFQGGMGNVNKYSNLSNFGYQMAGMGMQSELGGGQGGGGGGMNPAMLTSLMSSSGGGGGAAAAASDINLKEDIELKYTSPEGIPVYHFNYKDKKFGKYRYEGTMAQDLEELNPNAVITSKEGYKMVDYSLIDVNFRRVV